MQSVAVAAVPSRRLLLLAEIECIKELLGDYTPMERSLCTACYAPKPKVKDACAPPLSCSPIQSGVYAAPICLCLPSVCYPTTHDMRA